MSQRTERVGWVRVPQGDPPRPGQGAVLWEGAWECEGLSREGNSVCPRGPGETARRMNGPGEELAPRGDDVP